MEKKNILRDNKTSDDSIALDSVWKKKRIQSPEAFFRKALIRLAEDGMAPELFFGDFKLTEFNDEFIAASIDIGVTYSCQIGTPRVVRTSYYDEDYNDINKVVLDWNFIERKNQAIVNTVINKNWDGRSVDYESFQSGSQYTNRKLLEEELTEQYFRATRNAQNYDSFPKEGMTGEYEEQPIESFEVTKAAMDRMLNNCFETACEDYADEKYAKDLHYKGDWKKIKAYGLIIPRYRLTFAYNGANYSVVDGVWSDEELPTFEQYSPSEYDEDGQLCDKMMEEIKALKKAEFEKQKQKMEREKKEFAKLPFFTKLRKVFTGETRSIKNVPIDENTAPVKIQLSTPNGVVDKNITFSNEKNEKIIIGLAWALARYNLPPMSQDNYDYIMDKFWM